MRMQGTAPGLQRFCSKKRDGPRAAAFRQKLAGRRHSDSTALIRKDRAR